MVALGLAWGLVPQSAFGLIISTIPIALILFRISPEDAAPSPGAASRQGFAIADGEATATERWNALHESLNRRDWKASCQWIDYMASRPSLNHEVASLVSWLQV